MDGHLLGRHAEYVVTKATATADEIHAFAHLKKIVQLLT